MATSAPPGMPNRFDVVVFKYPGNPQKSQTPMNYIKRLCGLPGETIGIFDGDLYVLPAGTLTYPNRPQPTDSKNLWMGKGIAQSYGERDYTYTDDDEAIRLFHQGKFQILRKSPDLILATRRIVYDNDHQAEDLVGKVDPRWAEDLGEKAKPRPAGLQQLGAG